jgi:ABC-type multidrug transport system permease subunit
MHWIYVGFMIAIGIGAAYVTLLLVMMIFGAIGAAWNRIFQ